VKGHALGEPDALSSGGDTGLRPHLQRGYSRWIVPCLVVVACTLILAVRLRDGFIPADDPVQAHAAERVLDGDRPHVDFHDTYTGGLSYLNALALWLFGVRLLSLRVMLLLFFIPWVAAFWYIADKITSPTGASLLTLLAALWSVPLYPSPLPSWYNLYFATFGAAALLRYSDTRRTRWVFAAGLFAGISFLAKISGLYLLAGMMLFLLFDEQHADDTADVHGWDATGAIFSSVISLSLVAFVTALYWLVQRRVSISEIYHFVVPGASIACLLLMREWHKPRSPVVVRLRRLAARLIPLVTGAAIPVGIFLAPYAFSGTMSEWYLGVFVSPAARLDRAFYPPIHAIGAACSLPLLGLLLLNQHLRQPRARLIALLLVCLSLVGVVGLALFYPGFARWVWVSAATAIPVITIFGVTTLLQGSLETERSLRIMLFISLTALCSLVQFPFSGPFYFCYVVPLAILTFASLAQAGFCGGDRSLLYPLPIAYLLFVILVVMPNQVYGRGLSLDPVAQKTFVLPRAAGIRGETQTVEIYQQVVTEISKHAGKAPIWAGPDAAGIYFLAGHRNPTTILWEVFSGVDSKPETILASLDSAGVRTIVINHLTNVSGPPAPSLVEELQNRFPESMSIGCFEIRWRNGDKRSQLLVQ
jgi:hypothetical protein